MTMEGPLLCFTCTSSQNAFRRAYGLQADQSTYLELPQGKITSYQHGNNYISCSTVFGQQGPNRQLDFVNRCKVLFNVAQESNHRVGFTMLYLVDPTLDANSAQGENIEVVDTSDMLISLLSIDIGHQAKHMLDQQIFRPLRTLPQLRFGPNTIFQFLGNVGNVQQVLDASLATAEQHRRNRPARARRSKRKLPKDWSKVLKEAEEAGPGDVECMTCCTNKATICFVECGHQDLCDDCVRRMWTDKTIKRECPQCCEARKMIVRPILGAKREREKE